MKVLYVSHEKNLGGASLALLELIDKMIENKIEIYVLVRFNEGEFYNELCKRNVNIIMYRYYNSIYNHKNKFGIMVLILKYLINQIVALRVAFKIKRLLINVIHTNTSVNHLGIYISRYSGIKHIFHVREFLNDKRTSYVFSKKTTYKYLNKYTDRFIVISKALYNEYQNYFDINKMKLIYDGVDIKGCNSIKSLNKEKKKNNINIIVTGYVCENKGQEDIVRAIKVLNNKLMKSVKVYIVGKQEASYMNKLKKIISYDGIENNIEFLGYRNDVNFLRKYMDVEVNCSRSEGFGRTTIEAMLMKIPIIGANCTATKELIIDNENGLYYNPKNYNELANKIIYIVNNSELRKNIIKNAYVYAYEKFTVEKNCQEIIKLYKEIKL